MGQEIVSVTLLDGKVPLLQGISPFPFKVIKYQKQRVATRKDVDTDNSLKDGLFTA